VTDGARWSLRTRVTRSIIGVLLLLMGLVAIVSFAIYQAKSAGDDLVEQWDPAYTVSQNLLTAMVNEETGVRGYALAQDPALLEPYTLYRGLEDDAQVALSGYLAGYPELLDAYDAQSAAIDTWHETVGDPVLAEVRAGGTEAAATASSPEAKATFDRVRVTSAELTGAIGDRRAATADARERAFAVVWVTVGFGALVLLLTGLGLARGLRRQVLVPVSGLVDQTRQVADGDLTREIAQDGPRELADLAADVEQMRARLASQLESVERARLRLQQRSAELARSNADLEQFAYVASHDLSEPLRKVTSFSQLLERQYRDQLDDRARQYLAFMVDGAKRMQALIRDLLEFSRVGRTHEHFEPVDLGRALDRALDHLDDPIAGAGAVVERDPLPTVPGDPALLTALLQNLIGNAVKYRSPERPLVVRVGAVRQPDDWLLTIDDNGIGIDPEYAERIFVIFQRLHLRDEYDGTGIGLALCRRIVDFHGGRIWFDDKDEPGARFRLTLPVTQAPVDALESDEPAP